MTKCQTTYDYRNMHSSKQAGQGKLWCCVQTGLRNVEKLFLSHSRSREAWEYSSLLFTHFIIHCNEISLNIDQLFQVVPRLCHYLCFCNQPRVETFSSSWLVVSWFQWTELHRSNRFLSLLFHRSFNQTRSRLYRTNSPPPSPAAALYRVRARGLHSRMNSVQSQPSYANHKLNEKHPVCFVELEEREMSKGCIKSFIYV